MAFCRWSTDNFRCDLYCYESSQGFEVHVSGDRGLASDNQSYTCRTLEEFALTLTRLKDEGYRFPYDLIEQVRAGDL